MPDNCAIVNCKNWQHSKQQQLRTARFPTIDFQKMMDYAKHGLCVVVGKILLMLKVQECVPNTSRTVVLYEIYKTNC